MKAIVKIHRGGSAMAELKYCLDPNAKKKRNEVDKVNILEDGDGIEQINERVGAVYGYGVDQAALAAGDVRAVVNNLESNPANLPRKGKNTRHAVISVDWDELHEAQGRDAVNEKLIESAEDWLARFAPGCKAVVVRHDDSRCPHVHIIVENYDHTRKQFGKLPKRLDWRPEDLKEIQDFTWTKEFTSGRGSKKKRPAKKQSEHAKKLTIFKKEKKSERTIMYEQLINLLKTLPRSERPKTKEACCEALAKVLPNGWFMKTKRKNGQALKKPSITNTSGLTVRIETFWIWFLTERRKKSKLLKAKALRQKKNDSPGL
jgi:hypothetical protein